MLKKRIIPILQFIDTLSVKTKKFTSPRNVGDLLQYVRIFNKRQSDELGIINLNSKFKNYNFDFEYLKNITSNCNMPLMIGGSIKKILQIEELLKIGCDKIIFGDIFLENPSFIKQVTKNFGSQIIIAAVDINYQGEKYYLNYNNDQNFLRYFNFLQDEGVGEILINFIHKEGTMSGYDLNFIRKVYPYIKTSLIVNGGASCADDFKKVLEIDKVHGACASSIFLFSEETPNSIKKQLPKSINLRN